MTVFLTTPQIADLDALTALCLASKAHWGYDAAFMAACREELTVTADDLRNSAFATARLDGALAGVAQVVCDDGAPEIWKLFVAPACMGRGVGRRLFGWCADEARQSGAAYLRIEADPAAVPFYERMGASVIGSAPSGSIAGRSLPLMRFALRDPAAQPPTDAKPDAPRPR